MKILLIGDIVGNAGVKKVKQGIEEIKKKQNIDFIIAFLYIGSVFIF